MPNDSPPTQPRFRLAIAGSGIAGLTLAIALGQFDDPVSPVEIDIYESGPEITTVGAGISVWPRTWAIMRRLGLHDELMQEAVKGKWETKKNQDEGSTLHQAGGDDGDCEETWRPAFVGLPPLPLALFHAYPRAHTWRDHDAPRLHGPRPHLPAHCTIHTTKRLVSYNPPSRSSTAINGAYTPHFVDGTHASDDVLVGADGIKSEVRSAMYTHTHARDYDSTPVAACARCARSRPKWTGTVVYRYLIPTERLREVNPAHHTLHVMAPMSVSAGPASIVLFEADALSAVGKHIITYPISHGKYLNWIGFVTRPGKEGTEYPHKWVLDADQDDVVREFTGWEPEVDQMIAVPRLLLLARIADSLAQCVEDPKLWAIHDIEDLPFSVSGGVALIGGAVRAMTTHLGAGGGQAIGDAYLLGTLLTDPRTSPSRLPRVLEIYQAVRLPFARAVVRNARTVGLMYEFNSPGLYAADPAHGEPTAVGVRSGEEDRGRETAADVDWQWKEKVEKQWAEAERMMDELEGRAAPPHRRLER
ncbi:uncharacterized protein BXZ73DRAFT_101954 [Epithele typhae]|uniref:uncharacterized protein n=1 Tax=Epithele typhae TaxID=378194 RepID=UPI0020076547|nr:uncharacterized protein BXZ73DRAFT_101954 [Epithele typhae]KAH9929891.1 hypothetical protein BXZ73DRAFT_101954 [Epithele typhae]